MKTLWIGFSGESQEVRDTLALALVRELRTRKVNAQLVALRQPVKDCWAALGLFDYRISEATEFIQRLLGEVVFRNAASRLVAVMKDCLIAVVPDINDEADQEWIHAQQGLLWTVPIGTSASTAREASDALKPILNAIWSKLK